MKNLSQKFLLIAISVSVVTVTTSLFTRYIEAQLYQIYPYLKGTQADQAIPAQQNPLNCPQLEKVEGVSGTPIIKDKCTNTYWYNFDLPLKTSAASDRDGYTWQQSKDYCEGIALDKETNKPILRLPTSDELLAMVGTPCTQTFPGTDRKNEACSPLNRKSTTYPSGGAITPGGATSDYFYDDGNYAFAEGAYWASNEIDVNRDGTKEAAASVNLKYGTVNNPIFGKEIRLNVRCIYDFARDSAKMTDAKYDAINTDYQINSIQWWAEDTTASCSNGSKKLKMGYRSNLQPANDNINNCPEKLNTDNTFGQYRLCTGVTPFVDNCVIFECAGGKKPYKGDDATTPIVCNN